MSYLYWICAVHVVLFALLFAALPLIKPLSVLGDLPAPLNPVFLPPSCRQGCTCASVYQLVKCDEENLTDIPYETVRNNTRVLLLPNNVISSLNGTSLRRYRQLRYLDLGGNIIEEITDDAFDSQTKLIQLDLSRNLLTMLPSGAFSHLKLLRVLDLTANEITVLPQGSFANLTRLQNLSLRLNRLHQIDPLAFTGMGALVTMDLANNELEDLPDRSLNSCVRLDHLDMSANSLGTFVNDSEELGQFSVSNWFESTEPIRLHTLTLSNNLIDLFSSTCFRGMTALAELDLTGNYIREIPEDLFRDLVSLEILKLGYNSLYFIPSGSFNATANLLILKINNCELDSLGLPEDIFYNLTRLEILYLNGNALQDINFLSPSHLLSLRKLSLSENSIIAFQPEGFAQFQTLEILELSHNSLEETPNLKGLKNLKYLDMSFNYLTNIGPNAFIGTSLKTLDISSNAIQTLRLSTMVDIPDLQYLRLRHNPWACECHITWMLEPPTNYNFDIAALIDCVWPTPWRGLTLRKGYLYEVRVGCTSFPDKGKICVLLVTWLAVVAGFMLMFWAVAFHYARRRFRSRRPRQRFLVFRNTNESNIGPTGTSGHSKVRFKALDSETESLDDDETTV